MYVCMYVCMYVLQQWTPLSHLFKLNAFI